MMIKEKILKTGQELFRANKINSKNNAIASENYKGAPVKYFTLNKNEVSAYTKYGTTYTKTWNVTGNLKLVDILDYDTRIKLENDFTVNEREALNDAFPVNKKREIVSRNSSSVRIDNIVLKRLCNLGYDGYYMRSIRAFHSEVGLCPYGFSKLKMVKSEKLVMPEKINKTRKRSRINYNTTVKNNYNTTVTNNFKPSVLFPK